MKNAFPMAFWEERNFLNLKIRSINYIYEEMVIWFLPAENDQYGPRLLQIILLTFCILMKKAPVWFSGERTIVLSGEHSPQGKARNLLYKTMGGWFYSIPACNRSIWEKGNNKSCREGLFSYFIAEILTPQCLITSPKK